ncbi:hypothetical protein IAP91_11605 [Leuconostoc mesenteroides]|nr:hypothetical protein [Leuconostoc mesenteroides]
MKLRTAKYFVVTSILGGILLSLIIEEQWFKILATIIITASLLNYYFVNKKIK